MYKTLCKILWQLKHFFNVQIDKDGNISTKWSIDFDFRTNSDKEILEIKLLIGHYKVAIKSLVPTKEMFTKGKFVWNHSDLLHFYVTLANTSKYSFEKFPKIRISLLQIIMIYYNIRNRGHICLLMTTLIALNITIA